MIPATAQEWEALWAPYDEPTYAAVLAAIRPDDVVLEIGAGDLRLARRLAGVAWQVIAWERQTAVLPPPSYPLPPNLIVQTVDARYAPMPKKVTTAVLLMRHCQHFHFYIDKLRAAGCDRLITNARWGMGVETIHLRLPRMLYRAAPMGWYACWCGAVGFKPGPVERYTAEMETAVYEVIDCPVCHQTNTRYNN
jgi:hypothetical protein